MSRAPTRPRLHSLTIADPPAAWERLGFGVSEARLELGGVEVILGASGDGIVGWAIAGSEAAEVDGLAIKAVDPGTRVPADSEAHPNGASGIDHVVLVSPEFDRTAAALEQAGLPLRRVAQRRGVRQGFRRLGPAILELVEAPDAQRVRLWGLTVIVDDIDALGERLGEDLGPVKPAVQPGRRIATLRRSAGLSTPMAFMDPPPAAAA